MSTRREVGNQQCRQVSGLGGSTEAVTGRKWAFADAWRLTVPVVLTAAAGLAPLPAVAQSPVEIIAALPCSRLFPPDVDSVSMAQWLPLPPTTSDPTPLGIATIDWTDREYNALKARVRECGRLVSAPLARQMTNLLFMVDRQQSAQAPRAAELRRRRDLQQQLAASATTELATIQQLPDAQDQVDRLTRLRVKVTQAAPDTIEQVDEALEAAQVRRLEQAAAAEQSRQTQQTTQSQLAARQVASNALAELAAIGQLSSAQDQLNRLARLRSTAAALPPAVVQQVDSAIASAKARQVTQAAAAERVARLQQAERDLQAARQAAEQDEATAQQGREAAQLAQSRAAAELHDQQAAAEQAKADEARLAAMAQQRADIEARRREQALQRPAPPTPSATLPTTPAAPPVQADGDPGRTEARRRLAALQADAASKQAAQAGRVGSISRDSSLLDATLRIEVAWGYAPFLTLRQLLVEASANRPDLEQIAVEPWECSGHCVGLVVKQPGQPRAGILLRQEGHDLFAIGLIVNEEATQLRSGQELTAVILAFYALTGLPFDTMPDLTSLRPT